jgi:hypothetical protein
LLQVTGKKHQPRFCLPRRPAPSGVIAVGGRDKRVVQQGFRLGLVAQGRVAQFRWIAQGPGRLTGPRVVDGAGQPRHERRAQGLPGRGIGAEYREDGIPAGLCDRARRVITEITADDGDVQRAQLDSRGGPDSHLDTFIAVLPDTRGNHHLLTGPQRVVDPADRPTTDLLGYLVEPVQDRQDQSGSQQRRSMGWLCPVSWRYAKGRKVDQELST